MPDQAFVDISVDGIAMRCHPQDNTTEYDLVLNRGQWNAAEVSAFLRAVREGDTVIDLGANCGLFTLLASRAVGNGCVVAIEPNRLMVGRLLFNVNANGFTNVRVVACAISDEVSSGVLNTVGLNHGASSLHPVIGAESEAKRVAIRPLLNVLCDLSISRVDVLKLDIEGYEDRALLPLLNQDEQSFWPRAIMIETRHAVHWQRDCIAPLLACGYREVWRGEDDSIFERPA